MAGSYSSAKLELQSKPVQEILINNEDVPKQYIHNQQHNLALDSAISSGNVPVIDLSLLSSSSPQLPMMDAYLLHYGQQISEFYKKILRNYPWHATNHSVPDSILNKLQEVSKQFFQLPAKEKKRYSRSDKDTEGYGNDTILAEHQILDWCDRLYLQVFPEDQRRLHVWPEKPPAFRCLTINLQFNGSLAGAIDKYERLTTPVHHDSSRTRSTRANHGGGGSELDEKQEWRTGEQPHSKRTEQIVRSTEPMVGGDGVAPAMKD